MLLLSDTEGTDHLFAIQNEQSEVELHILHLNIHMTIKLGCVSRIRDYES